MDDRVNELTARASYIVTEITVMSYGIGDGILLKWSRIIILPSLNQTLYTPRC